MGQRSGAEDVWQGGAPGKRPKTGNAENKQSEMGTPKVWEWTVPLLALALCPQELTCGTAAQEGF